MNKGTNYINIRAVINENSGSGAYFNGQYNAIFSGFLLYLGTGFSSGSDWNAQPGGPIPSGQTTIWGVGCPTDAGAMSGYHFFTTDGNNEHVVVVLEKSAGIFGYFGWGPSIDKLGSWTGGPYFFGSMDGRNTSHDSQATSGPGFANMSAYCPGIQRSTPMVYIRADVDSFTNKWIGIGDTTTWYGGYTGKRGASTYNWNADTSTLPMYSRIMERLTNQLNGQSLLLPIRFGVERDAGGYSFIGSLPGIFLCNACAKGFTPATVYQWDTDNYMVFPGPSEYVHGGFAVKKVV
jgi:hypothetical protein